MHHAVDGVARDAVKQREAHGQHCEEVGRERAEGRAQQGSRIGRRRCQRHQVGRQQHRVRVHKTRACVYQAAQQGREEAGREQQGEILLPGLFSGLPPSGPQQHKRKQGQHRRDRVPQQPGAVRHKGSGNQQGDADPAGPVEQIRPAAWLGGRLGGRIGTVRRAGPVRLPEAGCKREVRVRMRGGVRGGSGRPGCEAASGDPHSAASCAARTAVLAGCGSTAVYTASSRSITRGQLWWASTWARL